MKTIASSVFVVWMFVCTPVPVAAQPLPGGRSVAALRPAEAGQTTFRQREPGAVTASVLPSASPSAVSTAQQQPSPAALSSPRRSRSAQPGVTTPCDNPVGRSGAAAPRGRAAGGGGSESTHHEFFEDGVVACAGSGDRAAGGCSPVGR